MKRRHWFVLLACLAACRAQTSNVDLFAKTSLAVGSGTRKVNHALNKPVQQSSTLGPGAEAFRAVDGDVDGNFYNGHVAITASGANPWWQVDLQAVRSISEIVVWSRTDCCASRLHKAYVFLSDEPFTSPDPFMTKDQSGVRWFLLDGRSLPDGSTARETHIPVAGWGRYVRVQLSDAQNNPSGEYLELAEVEVLGEPNLATGKTVTQSSGSDPFGPAKAIDGNVDGRADHQSVSQTNTDLFAFWQVDLGEAPQAANIGQVVLWNRTDCCEERLHNVHVLVSMNPIQANNPETARGEPGVHAYYFAGRDLPSGRTARRTVVPINAPGRYVRVQLSDTATYPAGEYLQLAEVEVQAAADPYVVTINNPELTSQGTPIARVPAGNSAGSTSLSVIRDGVMPAPGATDRALQFDTEDAGIPGVDEWIGYGFAESRFFSTVVLQNGVVSDRGGWFKTLRIQVRQNGAWINVANLRTMPGYPHQNTGVNFQAYQLDFDTIGGDGIRLIGQPGGTSGFISVAELRVFAGNPCAQRNDGQSCSDGDACTTNDVCLGHQCVSGPVMDCGIPDPCHTQSTCDRAIGACTASAIVAGEPSCDDGNACTVGDHCHQGTCLPGDTAVCPGAPPGGYATPINLGSFQGQSVAMDINNAGVVVGNDTVYQDTSSVEWHPGNQRTRAFHWTEESGMQYYPPLGPHSAVFGINDSDSIVGVGGPQMDVDWSNAFEFSPISGGEPRRLGVGLGTDINEAGQVTGSVYGANPGLRMFRWTGGTMELIDGLGAGYTSDMQAHAIDEFGTIVGEGIRTDGRSAAVMSIGDSGIVDLNTRLSPANDPEAQWDLRCASFITSASGERVIYGWGTRQDEPHAFRLTDRESGGALLDDLGVLEGYSGTSNYVRIPIPHRVNSAGEVVGAVYDMHGAWPYRAFVQLPGDVMVDLNDLIPPGSGWMLSAAFGINDNRDVVGFGYLDGKARAFKMRLPDMSPCPAPDGCHAAPQRDSSGACPVAAPVLADGTTCQDERQCGATAMCHQGACSCPVPVPYVSCVATLDGGKKVAVFGYRNDAPQGQMIAAEGGDGVQNALIVDGVAPGQALQSTWFGQSQDAAFSVGFATSATWKLAGSTAAVNASDRPCSTQTGPDGTTVDLPDGTHYVLDFNVSGAVAASGTIRPGLATGKTDGSLSVTADGAAAYDIPLWAPPGRAGLQPTLSVAYNSRNNNGPLGLGWALKGASEITRCEWRFNMDGVSRNARGDDDDRLCLDGKPLERITTKKGDGAEYREADGAFTRIVQHGDARTTAGATFEARRKDGIIMIYGEGAAAISTTGRTDGVPGHPDSRPSLDLSWSLSTVRDRRGNELRYAYSNGDHEHRLEKIYYVFPASAGASPSGLSNDQASRKVVFSYLPRQKPDSFMAFGHERAFKSLIDKIEMYAPAPSTPAVLRTYLFDYKTGTLSGRDLLAAVTECDGKVPVPRPAPEDRNGLVCKRPTTFYYSDSPQTFELVDDGEYSNHDDGGYTSPNNTWRGAEQIVDLNGDGLDDVLYARSTNPHEFDLTGSYPYVYDSVYVYRLSDGTKLGPETVLSALPAYIQRQQPSVTFTRGKSPLFYSIDLDADGLTDIVAPLDLPGELGYYDYYVFRNKSVSGTISFERDASPVFQRIIGEAFSDDHPAFIDLDGDGIVEIVKGNLVLDPGVAYNRNWTVFKANSDLHTYAQSPLGIKAFGPLIYPVHMGQRSGFDALMASGRMNLPAAPFASFAMDTTSTSPAISDPGLPSPNSEAPSQFNRTQWNYVFLDLNGDGTSDAVSLPTQSAPFVYDDHSWFGSVILGGADNSGGVAGPCPTENPDCWPFAPAPIRIRKNLGSSFGEQSLTAVGAPLKSQTAGMTAWSMDLNQDGRQDLILNLEANREKKYAPVPVDTDGFINYDQWFANISAYQSTGDGLDSPVIMQDSQGRLLPGSYRELVPAVGGLYGPTQVQHFAKSIDINGDGLSDIIVGPKLYVRKGGRVDLLSGVVDGLGHDVMVKYRAITDRTAAPVLGEPFYEKTADCAYPQYCTRKGVWAVSEVDVDPGLSYGVREQDPAQCIGCGRHGDGEYNKFYYAYRDARSSLTGDGWLGFGTKIMADAQRTSITTTTYDNTTEDRGHFWRRFKPATEVTSTIIPPHDEDQLQQVTRRRVEARSYTYQQIKPLPSLPHVFAVVPQSTVQTSTEMTTRNGHLVPHLLGQSTTTFEYDPGQLGNETSRKVVYSDGEIQETTTTYHPASLDEWLINLVDRVTETSTPMSGDPPATRTVAHDYDRGLLKSLTIEPDGDSTVYRHVVYGRNAFGQIDTVTETDRLGNERKTITIYDADAMFPVTVRNPLGQVTSMGYHPGYGLPVFTSDANNAVTIKHYDRFGRQTYERHPDGHSITTSYGLPEWAIGSYAVIQAGSDGGVEGTVYDRLDRPARQFGLNPNGQMAYSDTRYDAVGNVSSRSAPVFIGSTPTSVGRIDHDRLGRPIREWTQGGYATVPPAIETVTLHFYEGLDELTLDEQIDSFDYGLSRPRRRVTRNQRGQPTRTVNYKSDGENDWVATDIGYGVFGQVSSVETNGAGTSIDNAPRTFHYDSVGRNDSEYDADSMSTTYQHDAWGHRTGATDEKGQKTTVSFDPLDRAVSEESPVGKSIFTWDLAAHGIGMPASSVSAEALGETKIAYQYDVAGHPVSEDWVVDGASFNISRTFENGRLKVETYPLIPGRADRFAVEHRYSSVSGALESLGPPNSDASYWRVTARDPSLRVKDEAFGNGLVTRSLNYHPLFGSLETAIAHRGAEVVQDLSLQYDNGVNLTRRTDTAAGTAESFTHDLLGRLRYWASQYGQFNVEYRYDDLGNMTGRQLTRQEVEEPMEVFGHHGRSPRMVTSAPWGSYEYDDNGDQTGAPGRTVTFAPFHLPLTVSANGTTTLFSYTADHVRSSKRSPSASTVYVGGLYERRADQGGVHHVHYVANETGPVAQFVIEEGAPSEPLQSRFLLDDHLGSPVVIVASAGALSRPRYEPFGARLSSGDSPDPGSSGEPDVHIGFTGHEHDDDLGLIDMRGRIYDPRISRFLTPDPVMTLSPSTQVYHRYSYVQNSPLVKRDPSGFQAVDTVVSDVPVVPTANTAPAPQSPEPMSSTGTGNPAGVEVKTSASADVTTGGSTSGTSDIVPQGNDPGDHSYDVTVWGHPSVPASPPPARNQNTFPEMCPAGMGSGPRIGPVRSEANPQDRDPNATPEGFVNNAANAGGGLATLREKTLVNNGKWNGVNGKWYPLRWGGNGATGSRAAAVDAAKFANGVGKTAFGVGSGISFVQGTNALAKGDASGGIHAAEEMLVGLIGVAGGGLGAAFALGWWLASITQ